MNRLFRSLSELLGNDPQKPGAEDFTAGAKELHAFQRTDEERKKRIEVIRIEQTEKARKPPLEKLRLKRWSVLILVNLLFVLSFYLDIQILEGALTASRFVGFHMADLNSALQVILAYKVVVLNLLIGMVTVTIGWWLLGGRTFCSWVCPYHLLAEWTEMLHIKLAKKKFVTDHLLDRRARPWLWFIFVVLALLSGYTVYETISPTGILSRALIYGPGLALLWVGFLLLIEIFYSRRAWCRYACPIGLTYGFIGATSPLSVKYELSSCLHEDDCRKVCLVPHVLDTVIQGRARSEKVEIGADCTRCGRCVDICPSGALTFKFKGLGDLL